MVHVVAAPPRCETAAVYVLFLSPCVGRFFLAASHNPFGVMNEMRRESETMTFFEPRKGETLQRIRVGQRANAKHKVRFRFLLPGKVQRPGETAQGRHY